MSDGPDGPEAAGVAHINQFGKDMFEGALACSWTEHKGRILRSTRNYQPGEVILTESPLHIVQETEKCAAFKRLKKLCKDFEDDFDYEPLWYWCAIQSLTPDQLKDAKADGCTGASPETQHNLLLLHHEEVTDPSMAAKILAKELVPKADPITIERLIQIWVLNCFEYSDNPQGYSTYFFSSFMSHSCYPNAVWHYDGADHVLRSRRDIRIGDEVCISYLPESGLLQSAPNRRMELNETKRFWCDCERCVPGVDDLSRGLVCPKCGTGRVFAKTPEGGPAKDASLLASQLIGVECESCGEKVSKADATKLAGLEKDLQKIVDRCSKADSVTIKQIQDHETFIDKHFTQHVLADLAWEQFGSHYAAKRRIADQKRLLERRCEFHKLAYPGLSGAHAWALEALGDCMKSSSSGNGNAENGERQDSKQGSSTKKRVWQVAAKEETEAAKASYSEALRILRLMFGPSHEYVTDVEAKEVELAAP